jgi:DNA-binding transcriptional ArsR family regulator
MNRRALEKTLKAVANKRRLLILEFLLKEKEANVGEITEHLNLSYKSTSRHLSTLSGADIIDREQRSLEAYYRLSKDMPEVVKQIMRHL